MENKCVMGEGIPMVGDLMGKLKRELENKKIEN
jgi:hypothetical protein